MRTIGLLSIVCFTLLFSGTTYADSLYRQRLPTTVNLTSQDKLYVSYDFSQKTGIRCTTNGNRVQVDFTYKGKEKMAFLPVVLQSDHIPHKKDEALADALGRLTIYSESETQGFEVKCEYL